MTNSANIKADEWAIIKCWGSYERTPVLIERLTPSRFYYTERGRERFRDLGNVLLSVQTEDEAAKIIEKLISAVALRDQEARDAHKRHLNRVRKIVESALPAHPVPEQGVRT